MVSHPGYLAIEDDEHINDGWVMSTNSAELPGHFNQADVDQYFADLSSGLLPSRYLPSRTRPIQPDRPTPPAQPIQAQSTEFPFLLSTNNKPASCLTYSILHPGHFAIEVFTVPRSLCLIPCHWLRSLTAASGGNPFLTITVNRCPFLSHRFTSPMFKTLTSI